MICRICFSYHDAIKFKWYNFKFLWLYTEIWEVIRRSLKYLLNFNNDQRNIRKIPSSPQPYNSETRHSSFLFIILLSSTLNKNWWLIKRFVWTDIYYCLIIIRIRITYVRLKALFLMTDYLLDEKILIYD